MPYGSVVENQLTHMLKGGWLRSKGRNTKDLRLAQHIDTKMKEHSSLLGEAFKLRESTAYEALQWLNSQRLEERLLLPK